MNAIKMDTPIDYAIAFWKMGGESATEKVIARQLVRQFRLDKAEAERVCDEAWKRTRP